MQCGACGRALTVGARQCVYCGSGLGQGGSAVRGPRELQGPKGGSSGGSWGRRIFIVLLLLGIAAAAFTVPVFPCKTCAPGKEESCLKCLGKGKLTPVRYLTGGSTSP